MESSINSETGINSLSSGQVTRDRMSLLFDLIELISRPLKSIFKVVTDSTFEYLNLIVINPSNVCSRVKSSYDVYSISDIIFNLSTDKSI